MGYIAVVLFFLWSDPPTVQVKDFTGSLLSEATVLGFAEAGSQEILYRKQGNEFVPLFACETSPGSLASFFCEFGPMIYNPATKSVIFVGRHKVLNKRKPSLFELTSDDRLRLLVKHRKPKKNSRTVPRHQLAMQHLQWMMRQQARRDWHQQIIQNSIPPKFQ